jgi:hypothetical protein
LLNRLVNAGARIREENRFHLFRVESEPQKSNLTGVDADVRQRAGGRFSFELLDRAFEPL